MNEKSDLATQHVDWWLRSVRQLLIDNFVHGYRHGQEDAFREVNEMEQTARAQYLRAKRRPR